MRIVWAAALGLCLTACGDAAPPAPVHPQAAAITQARQANFKRIDAAYKAIGDELKKPAPDLEVVKRGAPIIADLALQMPAWFPAGTGAASGVRTSAQSDVWLHPEEFKAHADALAKAATLLDAAAVEGDLAAVKTAASRVGGRCRQCHDGFRQFDE